MKLIGKTLSELVPDSLASNQMIASRFIRKCIINKSDPETEQHYLKLINNFSTDEIIALCTTMITYGYSVMGKIMAQKEDNNDVKQVKIQNKNVIKTYKIPNHNFNLVSSLLRGLPEQQRQKIYSFEQPDGRSPASIAMENPDLHGRMHGLIRGVESDKSIELLNYYLLKLSFLKGYTYFLYYVFNNFQDARVTALGSDGLETYYDPFSLFIENFSQIKNLPHLFTSETKFELWNIDNTQWKKPRGKKFEPTTLLEKSIKWHKTEIIEFFISGSNKNQRKALYSKPVIKPEFAGQNILSLIIANNENILINQMFEDLTQEERVAAYQAGNPKYSVLLSLFVRLPESPTDKPNLIKILLDLSPDERFEFCNIEFKDATGPVKHLIFNEDIEISNALFSGFSPEQRIKTAKNPRILLNAFMYNRIVNLDFLLVDFDQPKMVELANLDLGDGISTLMLDIENNSAHLFSPMIKKMTEPERFSLCNRTLNYGKYKDITVLMVANDCLNLNLIESLVEGFSDPELYNLLCAPYSALNNNNKPSVVGTVGQNLALFGGFKLPIFKNFADRYRININELILQAFDVKINYGDWSCRYGFSFALTHKCTLVEAFSLQDRKNYLCSVKRPFINFFLNHRFYQFKKEVYFRNAAEWLKDFTDDEKKQALGDFIDFTDRKLIQKMGKSPEDKYRELKKNYNSLINTTEPVNTFDYVPASSAGNMSLPTEIVVTKSVIDNKFHFFK